MNCHSESENKAQMRAIVGMFATGDLRNVAKAIDRNYIDHQGLEGIEIRGPEGFSRVVTTARGAVSDLQIAIEDLIAQDDKVVTRLRWWGTTLSGRKDRARDYRHRPLRERAGAGALGDRIVGPRWSA